MKHFFSILLLMMLGTLTVFSQQLITGTVVDEPTKEPIPGVNILIKGSINGTITDIDGNFSITVNPEDVLIFSFVGYTPKSVKVDNNTNLKVSLAPDMQNLDELIVVGYGKQKKSDLTGSVSSVNAEEVQDVPAPGIDRALQGRVAGVQINANGGAPGSGTNIRIRGMGSIYSGNSPLFVVDGVPLAENVSIDNIVNPSDIERVDILKDAASAAIYGSRGSNGVIIITTKKGQVGDPMVSFSSYRGITNPVNSPKLANAEEYVRLTKIAFENGGRTLPEFFNSKAEGEWGEGTNWWNEILRDNGGSMENHEFSISGGTDSFKLATSLGYYNHKGYIKNSEYSRYNVGVKTDYRFLKFLQLGTNIRFSQTRRQNVNENNPEGGSIALAYQIPPTEEVLKTQEELDNTPSSFDINLPINRYSAIESTSNYNIVRDLEQSKDYINGRTLFGNIFIEGAFLNERLVLRSEYSMNTMTNDFYGYSPRYYSNANEQNEQSIVRRNYNLSVNWVNNNTITFSETLGNHSFSVMAGFIKEHFKYENINALGRETPSNDEVFWYINSTTGDREVYGGAREYALMSLLGRVFYSYDNRYMITANIRRDGTSRFSKTNNNRWGTFPSVSAGWNIHEENFFKTGNLGWFNSAKLRASWGQIGNQNIPNNAYVFSVLQRPDTRYAFGRDEVFQTGYIPANNANPQVRWETQETINFGADLSFFGNMVDFTAEYFIRTTIDNLLVLPQPMSAGTNDFWANAGRIQNKGLEFSGLYRNYNKAFRYSIGGNISFIQNEVLDLGFGVENLVSQPSGRIGGSISNTYIGSPIGMFYGYKTLGVFQNEDEVNGYNKDGALIQPKAKPGDFIFADLAGEFDENGNPIPDGKIDDNDRTIIGNPHPKFSYGFNVTAKYKGFDLSVFLQGQYGNDIFMYHRFYNYKGFLGNFNQVSGLAEMSWDGEGSTNAYPILNPNSDNNNHRLSDWWLSDGSYMRVKNVTLAYNIPSQLIRFIGKDAGVRIYVTGENLLTFTKYEGLDPELGSAGATSLELSVDRYVYPVGKTILGGIRVNF
jgi:TonB-linked SusC/RagA family outer membrane protein